MHIVYKKLMKAMQKEKEKTYNMIRGIPRAGRERTIK